VVEVVASVEGLVCGMSKQMPLCELDGTMVKQTA
jgi:hypothetical protein